MKASLLAILVVITSPFFVKAQVPDKDPFIKGDSGNPAGGEEGAVGINLSAFVELIKIPTASLHRLKSNPDLALSDGDEVRRAVQERIEQGEAKIVESALVTSASGVQSMIESLKEIIYPVAWDPPARLATTNVAPAGDGSDDDYHRLPVPMVENGIAYWPPSSYPHPTTIEMRPLGIQWHQEARSVANGREWEFNLAPHFVLEAGTHSSLTISTPPGPHDPVSTPTMRSWNVTVPKQTAPIGDTVWLGTVASPENSETEGEVSMMTFLRGFSQKPTNQTIITPPAFTLFIEFIEVEANDVNDYFRAHTDSEFSAEDLRLQLREKLESEKARLIELIALRCPLGQTARYSAVDERIYGTEFHPAQVPTYLVPNVSDESKSGEIEPFARYWSPSVYPTPSAFVTRNTGTQIHATIATEDETGLLLSQLQPEIVRYLGKRVISEFQTPRGMEPLGTMPIFSTLRVTTSVYMSPGDEILLGMASPWDDEGEWDNERRVLVFAKLAE